MVAEAARDSLYLVDAHSLIFQVFHALPMMSSPSGLPTNAVYGFTKDMLLLRRERKPTHLVCVFDVGERTFRDNLAADYKANRAPMPDDLKLQLPLIRQVLEAMRIPVLGVAGVEADDVIATLAQQGAARGMEVYLCTSDKDFRQLITDDVKMFNLRKMSVMGRDELAADWGVKPEQVIDFQTLVGDSVDNVKGVAGIGPKTASQLLQQYGTLDNILAHLDDFKGKKRENLEAAKPYLPTSRELVRLKTDVPVEEEWEKWRVQAWDGPRLLDLFRDLSFRGLSDMVRDSIRETAPVVPRASRVVQGSLFGGEEQTTAVASADEPIVRDDWKATYHLVNTPELFDSFLDEVKKQDRIAIDVTTSNPNPLDADIVGVAVCWKEGEAFYLPFCGPKGDCCLDREKSLAALKPILESPRPEKINQNIKFDVQALRRYGIDMQGVVSDPMVADYLLHAGQRSHTMEVLAEKHLGHRVLPLSELIGKGKQQKRMDEAPCAQVAEHAGEDADVAWRLCAKLEPLLEELRFKRTGEPGGASPRRPPASEYYLYDDLEIPLIGVLAEMEYNGVRLDVPLLKGMSVEMGQTLERLEKEIYRLAGREFNIGSVKQLRDILFKELGYKPKSRTAITREASTDQETLEELAKEGYELPKVLLEQRKIAKLKSTYVDALPALVNARTGRVHASFNQTVAATGRLSSSDPNLQNIPIRSEQGEQIRQAFIAEEGWKLITADYSQIELRLLAHFCEDDALKRAFEQDHDIHASVAAQVFGVKESEVNGNQRRMAKMINFGIIYGISAFGLAQRLEIEKEDAGKFIEAYFARYPRVLQYQEKLLRDCWMNGYVSTILGRRRAIEGIRERTSYKARNQPEREAINMQIQGSAADLIKVAMVKIAGRLREEKRKTRLLLQIHDELVLETPPQEEREMVKMVRAEMMGALSDRLTVPIKVDVGVGTNWLDVQEV
ncbi:MAG: DNA polymerase I [Gemmataceae bacterium]